MAKHCAQPIPSSIPASMQVVEGKGLHGGGYVTAGIAGTDGYLDPLYNQVGSAKHRPGLRLPFSHASCLPRSTACVLPSRGAYVFSALLLPGGLARDPNYPTSYFTPPFTPGPAPM